MLIKKTEGIDMDSEYILLYLSDYPVDGKLLLSSTSLPELIMRFQSYLTVIGQFGQNVDGVEYLIDEYLRTNTCEPDYQITINQGNFYLNGLFLRPVLISEQIFLQTHTF